MNSNTKTTPQLLENAVISWFLSLQFIFRPNWWLMNVPYSKEVDEIVLELLKNNEFKNISPNGCTVELGKATIWIENIPYGCIRLYETNLEHYRPSRMTILKALKKLRKLKHQNYSDNVLSVKRNIGLN